MKFWRQIRCGYVSVASSPDMRTADGFKQIGKRYAEAGIYYTTYAHMGNGIWSSGRATIRGAEAREFDRDSPNKVGVWDNAQYREPLSHGRVFTQDEIGENYTHFIREVAPVAEEAGVRIGIHPDEGG